MVILISDLLFKKYISHLCKKITVSTEKKPNTNDNPNGMHYSDNKENKPYRSLDGGGMCDEAYFFYQILTPFNKLKIVNKLEYDEINDGHNRLTWNLMKQVDIRFKKGMTLSHVSISICFVNLSRSILLNNEVDMNNHLTRIGNCRIGEYSA